MHVSAIKSFLVQRYKPGVDFVKENVTLIIAFDPEKITSDNKGKEVFSLFSVSCNR
jgi:hypothetical protein